MSVKYRRKNFTNPCCFGFGSKCSDCGYTEEEFKKYRESKNAEKVY